MAKKAYKKIDLYQEITDSIVAELEQGVCRWTKPWTSTGPAWQLPMSGTTGKTYRGVNILNLMGASEFLNNPSWITFKQAKELGGNVIKGQKGSKLVFFKELEVEDRHNEGEKVKIPMIKGFTVFNAEQIEGADLDKIKGGHVERPEAPESVAMDLANAVHAKVLQGGLMAANADYFNAISMPAFDTFKTADHYAATLFHELVHWTGSSIRLDRQKGYSEGTKQQRRDYAFEELVAELGSAFLCAHFGIVNEELQHAEYINSWIQLLKDDKKAIHKASSLAQKAVDYLLEQSQPQQAAA